MLVLTRREEESITLIWGDVQVVVTVTDIGPKKVKLGVTASEHIQIFRSELLNASKDRGRNPLSA